MDILVSLMFIRDEILRQKIKISLPVSVLGESVVAHFTLDLFQKNHHVYFDNHFSSVPLMEYLKTRNVFAYATIRSNGKYLPNNLKTDKVMNRGDFD